MLPPPRSWWLLPPPFAAYKLVPIAAGRLKVDADFRRLIVVDSKLQNGAPYMIVAGVT